MPKLSIITINLNNKEGLQKTMASVFCQTFSDFEYIIIDGGSTDGSVDEINPISDKLAYWVSEPDTGIYNAMNKGIEKSTGDIICFLNSGDQYYSDTAIEMAVNSIDGINEYSWIYFFDYIHSQLDQYKFQVCSSDVSNKARIFVKGFGHPSTFYRKEIFNSIGNFDESLKIAADREFYLRAILKHKLKFSYFSKPISVFNEGGISTNPKYSKLLLSEEKKIQIEYFDKIERVLFSNRIFRKIYSIAFFQGIARIFVNWDLSKNLTIE